MATGAGADRKPLDEAALRRGLEFWSSVDVVESTGSTNADLLARAGLAGSDRSALIAEHQSGGRGRHGRAWVSPPRAQLALSVLLRMPGIDPVALGWLPVLAGLAAVDALAGTALVDAQLKWPNDVLIDGRKVAGILAEVVPSSQADAGSLAVVVGIGLNVSLAEDELPVPHATSLTLARAHVTDRTVLARALLDRLAEHWLRWRESGWSAVELAALYRERCATIGARVRAELPGGRVLTGTAAGVDESGRLVIRSDDGTTTEVAAGDVTHLRPE
ncbi:MAG: biotin--[acetyl-CoA-carboxylase] ligase [Mycobacteriaceae bacterium]|nr:biotin--[acetyl-CoA-carboxylase] ligase [Mycobacteriaceae bacterium]